MDTAVSTGNEALLWTLDTAAEALSVSPRTVRRLLDAGDLDAVRIGRAVRVSVASVRSYVYFARPSLRLFEPSVSI